MAVQTTADAAEGQTDSTWRSDGWAGAVGRRQRAGRQACTHSPQATQEAAAQRIALVEGDAGLAAAEGQADHVVALLVAAGAQAACALDAGIQVDRDRRMAEVGALHGGPAGGIAPRASKRAGSAPRAAVQCASSLSC